MNDPFAGDYRAETELLIARLARALDKLRATEAVSLPLLGARGCRRLSAATAHLAFRPATPVVGEGARAVKQDFELCMDFPPHSLFRRFAAALGALVEDALARLEPPPVARPFHFNDLIVQRYRKGSRGITPHRDHLRYRGLVALMTLSGAARFCLCADRSGQSARELPCPPGTLLMLRAPGFAGHDERPFHFLCDVTRTRLGLGLRYDARTD